MKKKIINILKYLIFFAIGATLFWGVYGDMDMDQLKLALHEVNYFWVAVSIIISLFSQVSRAIRWNMLIEPMGYRPRLHNTFLSVLVLYLVNLFLPRAGEIGRCTVLSKYENIPFTKLVGTVFVERIADLIGLLIIAFFIVIFQINRIKSIFEAERMNAIIKKFTPDTVEDPTLFSPRNVLIGIGLLLVLFFVVSQVLKSRRQTDQIAKTPLKEKIREVISNMIEGVKTILRLKNKWYFVFHTAFIFLMWLLMLYAIFLAFEPTKHLSLMAGATTFLMGGLAMILPIQGGIGPWHIMVILTLSVFHVSIEDAEIFALIAHSATNLIYILFGLAALLVLLMLNKKGKQA